MRREAARTTREGSARSSPPPSAAGAPRRTATTGCGRDSRATRSSRASALPGAYFKAEQPDGWAAAELDLRTRATTLDHAKL